jgi:hypothetical protein
VTSFKGPAVLALAAALIAASGHAAAAPRTTAPAGVSVFHVGRVARHGLVSHRDPALWTYRLPQGARQGRTMWYVLRLHVEVAIKSPTRSLAYLAASTNGWTAAQIELKAVRTRGRLVTSTSSLGLVDGLVKTTRHVSVFRLRFANYLQRRGVQGGLNRLVVRVDSPAAPRALSVRVLPDTGIVRTTTPPPSLSLHVSWRSGESPHVGKQLPIHWSVTNRSSLAALDVRVAPVFDGRDFKTIGPTSSVVARLDGTRHGTFTLVPLRSVRTRLFVRAESPNANSPAAAIAAVVLPRQASRNDGYWRVRIIGALLLALGLAFLSLRRRAQA